MAHKFEAFTCDTAVENLSGEPCSICVWKEHVVVGLEDGRILLLHAASCKGVRLATAKVFHVSSHPIVQLQALSEESLLIVLTNDGVNIHRLPDFSLICQANNSRDAAVFTWDDARAMLAVAVERLITLFNLHGGDLLELQTFNTHDHVSSLLFHGENLFVCTKTNCSMINVTTATTTEIFSSSTPFTSSINALPSGEVMVTRDNLSIFFNTEGKPSRHAPLTWSAPPVSLAVSPPYAVAALPDTIEVRSISKMSNNTVFQSILVPNMSTFSPILTDKRELFIAGAEGIKCLKRTSWSSQCWTLAAQGEFSVATELLQLIPHSEVEQRQILQDMLRVLQGFELFSEGEIYEGLAQISLPSSSTPHPLMLLCLYPSLVPTKYHHLLPTQIHGASLPHVKEPAADSYPHAVRLLMPYLMDQRAQLVLTVQNSSTFSAGIPTATTSAGIPTAMTSDHQVHAESSMQGMGTAALQEVTVQVPKAEVMVQVPKAEVTVQVPKTELLMVLDTLILKAQLLMPDTGALLHFVQQENKVDLQEAEKELRETGRYAELAALYQRHGSHAAGLDLLSNLSQTAAALPVKPTGAAADLPGLPGVWAGLRYLMGIGHSPDAASLAKAHARWMLQQDPEAALEAYLQMKAVLDVDTVLSLLDLHAPQHKAAYLEAALNLGITSPEKYHSLLSLLYLQMISELNPGSPDGQPTCLVPNLAARVKSKAATPLELFPASASSGGTGTVASDVVTERGFLDAYQRLKELVRKSRYLDPAHLLTHLPVNALPEIRALLYEQLGQYKAALHLYCHVTMDATAAEAYCDRVYDALMAKKRGAKRESAVAVEEGSYLELIDRPADIYMELMLVLMRPDGLDEEALGSPAVIRLQHVMGHPFWPHISGLLSRKADRVKPQQLLKVLRHDPTLEEVYPFIEDIMLHGGTHYPIATPAPASRQLPTPDPSLPCDSAHINSLPQSVLHEILSQDTLGPKELCAVSATCRYWNKLNKDAAANKAWKEFYSMKWIVGAHEDDVSWQHMYGLKMRRIASWAGKYTQDNFYGHKAGVRCLKLLPSHGLMATGSLDRTLRLWSLTSGLPISTSKIQPGTVRAIAMDGHSLISGGMDNAIRIWSADHNRPDLIFDLNSRPSLLHGHIGPVSCLSMTEHHLFSGSWDYTVRIWNRSDWNCSQVLKFTDWVWCMAVRGNNLLVSAGPEVLVHDLATGKVVRKFQNLHDGHVCSLEGTQNSKLMFSGAADGLVMQHDLRMKDPSSVLWHHSSGVNGLAFEDPWLTSCSSDGSAMLMNYEAIRGGPGSMRLTSTCRQLAGPGGPIYCVDIADQWLACGADSDVVRTWDFTKASVAEQRRHEGKTVRRERRKPRRRYSDPQPPKQLVGPGDGASGSGGSAVAAGQPPVAGGFGTRQVNSVRYGRQPVAHAPPHAPPRGAPGQVWQVARPRTPHQPSVPVTDKRTPNRSRESQ